MQRQVTFVVVDEDTFQRGLQANESGFIIGLGLALVASLMEGAPPSDAQDALAKWQGLRIELEGSNQLRLN